MSTTEDDGGGDEKRSMVRIDGVVYDVTNYMSQHKGGYAAIAAATAPPQDMKGSERDSGVRDATALFRSYHRMSTKALKRVLAPYVVDDEFDADGEFVFSPDIAEAAAAFGEQGDAPTMGGARRGDVTAGGDGVHLTRYRFDDDFKELTRLVAAAVPQRTAPSWYYAKAGAIFFSAVALEAYLAVSALSAPATLVLRFVLGLLVASVGLNIQHDASHMAISRRPWVNLALAYTQNWIGGSAVVWRHQHVVQHHTETNHFGRDPNCASPEAGDPRTPPVVRMHRDVPENAARFWWQHAYIWAILPLNTFNWHFAEAVSLWRMRYGGGEIPSALRREVALDLFVLKPLFVARFYVLPFLLSPSSAWLTAAGLAVECIVGGAYLTFFFILSHNFEGAHYFDDQTTMGLNVSWLYAQVASSCNVGGRRLAFFNGGLNYQIEHHLFPHYSHAHYPRIAEIVAPFCKQRGIPYVHYDTVWENVVSTAKALRTLGRQMGKEKAF